MSVDAPTPPRPRDWWARPKVVLPVVGAIALLVALLTPEPTVGRIGDSRLSSHLTGSLGAAALAQTAQRFGFHVVQRDSSPVPDSTATPGGAIHAVLAPPTDIDAWEAHQYLERVRGGDAMLFVIGERNALSDSLHVRVTSGDYARELRARGSPRYSAFRSFARRFDAAVYGHGQCDAAALADLVALADPFRGDRDTRAA